ncbi:MAG TPA: amidase family protein, partial [Rhizomicrobium sp.]|nr:amidase family protein [Rhizomicrobium sp.]
LPMRGHVPPPPGAYVETDLGVGGPMARNVDDLKMLWSVLRGTPEQKRREVKGARIAIWDEEKGFPLSAAVRDGVKRAGDALAAQGAHVERAKPGIDTDQMMRSYMQLLVAVMAGGFPETLLADMEKTRAEDRTAYAAGASLYGPEAYRLFATARVSELAHAMVARQAQKDALAEFFKSTDAIVMPITPVPAFAHDQSEPPASRSVTIDNETWPYFSMLSWIALATSLHAPALAVQAGHTPEGLPVGVQIVGPWNSEDRLFDYAASIEDGTGGFKPPPL